MKKSSTRKTKLLISFNVKFSSSNLNSTLLNSEAQNLKTLEELFRNLKADSVSFKKPMNVWTKSLHKKTQSFKNLESKSASSILESNKQELVWRIWTRRSEKLKISKDEMHHWSSSFQRLEHLRSRLENLNKLMANCDHNWQLFRMKQTKKKQRDQRIKLI